MTRKLINHILPGVYLTLKNALISLDVLENDFEYSKLRLYQKRSKQLYSFGCKF